MRWQTGRRSGNVEDRRGSGPLIAGGGIGIVVIALIAMLFGVDPREILQPGQEQVQVPAGGASGTTTGPKDEMSDFVSAVLAETEDVWQEEFRRMGKEYVDPKLVLFTGAVQSACGIAQTAVGPFYCPLDQKVYIDLAFYRDLKERFHAPGDFAEAYVIAHEVGHHVQNLLGIAEKVHEAQSRADQEQANALSVRQELQADCLAGIWAYHAQKSMKIVEEGDIEEALNAASAIGDDRLQMQSRGYVSPESFTHGSSEQRVSWFRRGFASGDLNQCDTFRDENL